VDAARPTARPLLSFQKFVAGAFNATLARLYLFRIIDPADELIASERGELFPQRQDFRIGSQRGLKVVTCLVDRAVGKSVRHKTSGKARLSAILDSGGIQAG